MSNVIVEEGYPANFHLGISMIFWLVFIFIAFCIGTILIIKALKTQLINRKELYISYSVISFGIGITFIVIQIGVFLPIFFKISISLGTTLSMFCSAFFIFYWEKNLINLRKIPTIWSIFAAFFAFLDFIIVIIMGMHFLEFITLISVLFAIISELFLFILLILFTKRVIGDLRVRGFMMLFGEVFLYAGIILDHPPFVTLYPSILSIVSPVCLIIGLIIFYFGVKRICDAITSYYNQEQICTVHRGKISKGTHIYFCPNCNTTYCQNCYEQVIKRENCWNCGVGDFEPEVRLGDEEIVVEKESKEKALKKQKFPKKE